MKAPGGFRISEESDENLLCIPFSEEQLEEIKKYAAMNEMEVEEFLKNVCLTHCLQQMEYIHGQRPEASETAEEEAAKSENGNGVKSRAKEN